MVEVIKVENGVGVGFHGASEFLHVMGFLQEIARYAHEAFEEEDTDAHSPEELIGRLCMVQLAESARRIEENPEMLEEIKIAASMEMAPSRKDYNDSMYG